MAQAKERPPRKELRDFVHLDIYGERYTKIY